MVQQIRHRNDMPQLTKKQPKMVSCDISMTTYTSLAVNLVSYD